MSRLENTLCLIALMWVATSVTIARGTAFYNVQETDEDFVFQGEYVGELNNEGKAEKYGVQVIAVGKGKFNAIGYHGGLPGDGWDGEAPFRTEQSGELTDDTVTFANQEGDSKIRNGLLTIADADGNLKGQLKKITRESKTLNKLPIEGAVVLFDGKDANQWENGKVSDEGWLEEGTTSKQKFGSLQMHIEFRLPYQPEASGQARGNSGIYLQGRYEVQMLDSFGLIGKDNECGGLYSIKACDLNMCYPPLSWQTYDIEYTAAKYEEGKLVANPRITVLHNGIKIHDNVELPGDRNTTAAPVQPGTEPGPLYLQNHGNPVRYRNIWVRETNIKQN